MRPPLSLPGARPASEPVEKIDIGATGQSVRRRDGRVEVEVRHGSSRAAERARTGSPGAQTARAPGSASATGVLTDEEHDEVRRELGLDEASMRRALGVDDWKARRKREEGGR